MISEIRFCTRLKVEEPPPIAEEGAPIEYFAPVSADCLARRRCSLFSTASAAAAAFPDSVFETISFAVESNRSVGESLAAELWARDIEEEEEEELGPTFLTLGWTVNNGNGRESAADLLPSMNDSSLSSLFSLLLLLLGMGFLALPPATVSLAIALKTSGMINVKNRETAAP